MSSVTKDYFYADNYFDYAAQLRSYNNHTTNVPAHAGSWGSLTRLVLVILARIGFVLIQIGSVPVNNVNLILLQNVIDLCCVTFMYFFTGFLIAYSGDQIGIVGQGRWIGDPTTNKDEAILGWQAVAVTSAICTTVVVGRMHTLGYLLMAVVLAGLIEPFLIHWIWTIDGWMTEGELLGKRVVFRDYAGAAVVHVVGGLSGLIGSLILGRRMLRLRDLDDASITVGSAGTVFSGLLLIFVGLQGFCTNASGRDRFHVLERDPSHAYVNNLLAASSCTLLVAALHFIFNREAFNHWTVTRCVQGMVAGVIATSAAANEYSPQVAIGLGCLTGVVFFLVSRLVFCSALEDYCNVVALHLTCALFGSLVAPLCAARANEDVTSTLLNFSWQLICLAALMTLVTVVMLPLFGLLRCCGILRNRTERSNHLRANAALDRGPPRSFLQRLFPIDNASFYLLPPSAVITDSVDVASRFWRYQTELDKLESGRPVARSEPVASVDVEESFTAPVPGVRVKKARQVHTLSANTPVFAVEPGGTGESIGHDLPETGKKLFLGREIRCSLDPIEEMDEEGLKELEVTESVGCYEGEDRGSILPESFHMFADSKDPRNYQLRRTMKLTNLHHEFVREDIKVVLGPRRLLDSSSSDSCDEDGAVARTIDPSESVKSVEATSFHGSSFHSGH